MATHYLEVHLVDEHGNHKKDLVRQDGLGETVRRSLVHRALADGGRVVSIRDLTEAEYREARRRPPEEPEVPA